MVFSLSKITDVNSGFIMIESMHNLDIKITSNQPWSVSGK